MRRMRGFTLIEMMAVVLILGLVMSIVVVNVMQSVEWAKVETTKVKMKALEGALEMTRLADATYPDTDPGLASLLERRPGIGRIVEDAAALDDAWKRRFGYQHPGSQREESYDLWSFA